MGGGVVEAGGWGVEEKSETRQKKSQPLPSISQVPKEKEQKTRLPPLRNRLLYTRKVPATSHLEKGEGGVYSAFSMQRPSGPARRRAQAGAALAAPRHPRPPPPAHRQVLALPGAPLPLCGRVAPAGARMPAGQLRRCRAAGQERGPWRRCRGRPLLPSQPGESDAHPLPGGRAPERGSPRLPTAGSHSQPTSKSLATPKAT